MSKVVLWSVAVTVSTVLAIRLVGQTASPERQLVLRAAEALGGLDRVMALKTLQIIGYGELAYMNGGGNITADPDAPQKWQKVLDYRRTIDLEHGRTRVEQRLKMDFVFASEVGQLGLNRTSETLDGEVAYNIGAGFLAPQGGAPQPQAAGAAAARQRRVELVAHPITIVRAALDATSRLSNLRRQGNLQLVDVTVHQGDTLRLAVDAATNLPAWVSYVGPNANLGDVTYKRVRRLRAGAGCATANRLHDHHRFPECRAAPDFYVNRNIARRPRSTTSAHRLQCARRQRRRGEQDLAALLRRRSRSPIMCGS